MLSNRMKERVRFFATNGWVVTPPGRIGTALNYARAEEWLESRESMRVRWDDDPEPWDGDGRYVPETLECCLVETEDEKFFASLCSIDNADANYRRVIEAELASEIMSQPGSWAIK